GLRGPITVVAAVALTTIPFHWLRIEHVYLASMFSAVLGVGLAILFGTGEVARRTRDWRNVRSSAALVMLVVTIAISSIYYACFTLLLCGVAVLYRFARGASPRTLMIDVGAIVSVALALGLALAPSVIFEWMNPALAPVA